MTPEQFFGDWTSNGNSVALITLNGRHFVEVCTRGGRTIGIPIADASDVAAAIQRVVSAFVASECAKKVGP